MTAAEHPFERLTPDFVLDAVEAAGFSCDGRLFALNSYENRVYQVGRDSGAPLIAKFYRPGRWSDAAIEEEHAFVLELEAADLPVVAPLPVGSGTYFEHDGFRVSLYPRRGGRAPELDREDTLRAMGRYLARMHAIGRADRFEHRGVIDIEGFGTSSVTLLMADWIPRDLQAAFEGICRDVLTHVEQAFDRAGDVRYLRVHGDCHGGNILWRDEAPHFVDFDDARMAPAVQDLWMLLSGPPVEQRQQMGLVLEGYESFADFDYRELELVEALRSLRMLHHSAWLARRWHDPAFPAAFPWFGTQAYWEQQILDLKEQLAALSGAEQ